MVSGIALGLATCVGMADQTAPTAKGETMHISIQEVHVQRVNIVTTEPFDTVVARIVGPTIQFFAFEAKQTSGRPRHLGHRQGQKIVFRRDLNVKEVL